MALTSSFEMATYNGYIQYTPEYEACEWCSVAIWKRVVLMFMGTYRIPTVVSLCQKSNIILVGSITYILCDNHLIWKLKINEKRYLFLTRRRNANVSMKMTQFFALVSCFNRPPVTYSTSFRIMCRHDSKNFINANWFK